MTQLNKHTKFGVVDPKGSVINSWLTVDDIDSLAEEVGIDNEFNTSVTICNLESEGYVITVFRVNSSKIKVPKETLYDDWKFLQNK